MNLSRSSSIRVVHGDITTLSVDAIVNAANASLLGGGGVDGAIHAAAGPELREQCKTLGGCATGMAKMTAGYKLPARYIIHTVGPIWSDGRRGEADLLQQCYKSCLALAMQHGLSSIAFPCISTGAYEFPKAMACGIAWSTACEWLSSQPLPADLTFCCFDQESFKLYSNRLNARP